MLKLIRNAEQLDDWVRDNLREGEFELYGFGILKEYDKDKEYPKAYEVIPFPCLIESSDCCPNDSVQHLITDKDKIIDYIEKIILPYNKLLEKVKAR